jgi:hypothetical protein
MTKTSKVRAMLCEVTDERIFRRYQLEKNMSGKMGLKELAGFFCTTTQLDIGRWWSKSTLPSIMRLLHNMHHIPRTYHRRTFCCFLGKKKLVLKGQRIAQSVNIQFVLEYPLKAQSY